uniref:Uncharacterized protein n=1 Tax=Aegilops tauschii subsp. strangulata TaxID=200361 RepID=A0A452YSM7_AEGTS
MSPAGPGHAGHHLARRPRPGHPRRPPHPGARHPRQSSRPVAPGGPDPVTPTGLHPGHRPRPRGRVLCLASSTATAAGDSALRALPIHDLPCVPPERGWDGVTRLSRSRRRRAAEWVQTVARRAGQGGGATSRTGR